MQKKFGSKTDTLKAFDAISKKQMAIINFIAAQQIYGTSYSEPLDLIHEALYRSLTEKRKWPTKVPFAAYILQVIKSIANNERKGSKRISSISLDADEHFDLIDLNFDSEYPLPNDPAQILQEKQELIQRLSGMENLITSFADDLTAATIIKAWLAHMKTKSILAQNNISKKDFEAARRRISRHIKNRRGDVGKQPDHLNTKKDGK